MSDISKLLRYVSGFNKEVDLNGGSDILKVSSVKIGTNSAEITTTIADKLVKIGDITDGASGADQVGATAVRTQVTVQSVLEKLDTDLGTAESTLSSHVANTSNPHSVTKTQVGLGNVDNVQQLPMSYLDIDDTLAADSDLKVPSQKAVKAYADTKIPLAQKGANNGVATLDGGGKIPVSQLPNSVMEYQGVWNASTNSPSLADGVGSIGDVYRVTVAGSQDLGSGSISFTVGDYAILNSSLVWEKADTTDAVASVNGQTGIVVLNSSHISENTNLYFTDERAQDAIGAMIADTSTIDITYTDGTPELKADVKADSISNSHINSAAGILESKLALDYSTSSLNTAISNHLSDAVDAHDASAISYVNTTSGLTATEVQAAIDEVEGRLGTAESTLSSHVANTSNPHSVTKTQVGLSNVDNVQQLPLSYLDTDGTLAANSDLKVPSQKAVKTYVDGKTTVEKIAITYTNNTGSQINAGDVVALSTSVAGEIVLGDANFLASSEGIIGVAFENIANGASGKVQVAGEAIVNNGAVNFDIGKSVYVSQTAGQATKTAPSANVIRLGRASATNKIVLNVEIVLTV